MCVARTAGLPEIDRIRRRVQGRRREVSEFSRWLRAVVAAVHVPVLVLALLQMNRDREERAIEKPAIGDLQELGLLERDAGRVILLHRESAYEKDDPRQGEADFIVAAHRDGPTDTITVAFHGMFSRFGVMPSCRRDCRPRISLSKCCLGCRFRSKATI